MARKRRFGDRAEGRRLRTLDPLYNFIPFIMVQKNDACNQFADSVEITETDRWLRAKRKEGYKGLGYLHLFIASYVRAASQRPCVNRFIAGRRIFARNNIEVVLTVRRGMSSDAGETTIKVIFDPSDTVFDVYRKMEEKINEIKDSEEDNNTEAVARALTKLPRFILSFAIWILKIMDYFGLIPMSLLNASPFHGSMIITDLGSLRIGPVYHHIYNFGTLPVFIAFGAKYHKYEINRHGRVEDRKYIDTKMVLAEGTVDGHYYAQLLRAFRYIFEHPEIVETPPTKVVEDVR